MSAMKCLNAFAPVSPGWRGAAFGPRPLTDGDGEFAIQNIEAQEYVMVIGDVMGAPGAYVIVPNEANQARVWNLTANQILDAGELQVELTQ